MSATENQIRTAIGAIISANYPQARVFNWNALSHDVREWAGMFRQADGLTHGWIIKASATNGNKVGLSKTRRTKIFDVWGFYGFRSVNETDNSDNEFAAIRETLETAFENAPLLNIAGIRNHELLQFGRITTLSSGEEILHFAEGKIVIVNC